MASKIVVGRQIINMAYMAVQCMTLTYLRSAKGFSLQILQVDLNPSIKNQGYNHRYTNNRNNYKVVS